MQPNVRTARHPCVAHFELEEKEKRKSQKKGVT
jgi:hypothetical protein